MKQDILNEFRKYLESDLPKNTAKKYYFSIKRLFRPIQFNHVSQINKEFIEAGLPKFKTKNDFSAVKNGLLRFKEYFPELTIPDDNFFKSVSLRKKNWNKKPKNTIYLDETKRKINALKDRKMKYAFRLALVSGLRAFELAALTKEDIVINQDNTMTVTVKKGKGDERRVINTMVDKYLGSNLPKYMNSFSEDEKLFYSNSKMQHKAKKLCLQMHDLRRIAAINCKAINKTKMNAYEANQQTMQLLGHARFSTTKRYLYNKKLKIRKRRR